MADTPVGCTGSSRRYIGCLIFHLKIYRNPRCIARPSAIPCDIKKEVSSAEERSKTPGRYCRKEEKVRTWLKTFCCQTCNIDLVCFCSIFPS